MAFDQAAFASAAMFGVGLAVDAFLIALSNGLYAPKSKRSTILLTATIFAVFQFAAPLIGHLCVHFAVQKFSVLEKILSWLALAVLCALGIKMIVDGIRKTSGDKPPVKTGFITLVAQAAASSVDALSVGFAIADYTVQTAVLYSGIIAAVTFAAYIVGFFIGKKFGVKLANGALVVGGIILIAMGVASIFL